LRQRFDLCLRELQLQRNVGLHAAHPDRAAPKPQVRPNPERDVSKEKILGIAIVGGLLVVLILTTVPLKQHTAEVCMTFNGRSHCATATGTTREEALRSATSTACAPISSGVTETIACDRTPPTSVTWQ
jgi:hypothetical protein